MKWLPQPNLVIYDRDEESVVCYHSGSGETHLISAFAAHVLKKITAKPLSTAELVDALYTDVDPDDVSELKTIVPDLLDQLAELDIVTSSD